MYIMESTVELRQLGACLVGESQKFKNKKNLTYSTHPTFNSIIGRNLTFSKKTLIYVWFADVLDLLKWQYKSMQPMLTVEKNLA